MVTLENAILRLTLAAATLAVSASAFAQDAPVERPSVDRPACLSRAGPSRHPWSGRPRRTPAPAQAHSATATARTTKPRPASAQRRVRHQPRQDCRQSCAPFCIWVRDSACSVG